MTAIQLTRAQRRRLQYHAESVDRVTQADARFFERFPRRRHRVRLASQAEIEQSKVLGVDMRLQDDRQHYVVVRNVAPGMRLRQSIVGPRDADTDVSEHEARALYEMIETDQARSIEAQMRQAAEARHDARHR